MQFWDILGYFVLISMILLILYIYMDTDSFQLKCVVSTVDGNKYCVRERDNVKPAADLLAKITENMRSLVDYVYKKHPNNDFVKRLHAGFDPKKINETLPTSVYTAYSENKGEKLAFCLNVDKKDNAHLIDEHTLTFVAIHELSHIGTKSIGHKSEFWENFKFLLENAKEAGIHDPTDYKSSPQKYCGMTIKDNPFYDV
jgi:hypothetical protein